MPNPNEILGALTESEKNMNAEIDRLQRVRQLFAKNSYDGKYRDQFEDVYEEILEAKDVIEDEFIDGFQFGDLEDILVAVAPVLKDIYDEFYGTLKDEKEVDAFLRDLVIFLYYEVEEKIKTWGWLKGILRIALRLWIAGKLAKYMKIAFEFVDGEVTALTGKVQAKVDKYLDFLS